MSVARLVTVRWSKTAETHLRKLPLDVQRGLVAKAREIRLCDDPRKAGKPLTDKLRGFYRITYGRYRAIYSVTEKKMAGGQTTYLVHVRFLIAGIRKEGDKRDIYRIAERLAVLGVLDDDRDSPELS